MSLFDKVIRIVTQVLKFPKRRRKSKKKAKAARPSKKRVKKKLSNKNTRASSSKTKPSKRPKKKASKVPASKSRKAGPKKSKKRAVKKKVKKERPIRTKKRIPVSKKSAVLKKLEVKDKPEGELVGEITHYFSRIQVIVIKMLKGTLRVGDDILIQGKATKFRQKIKSLQIESVDVKAVRKGELAGLKVSKKAKEGDKVYKI